MLYVLLEIAILLLIAIALGLLVGWLLWRWRRVNLARSEYRQLLEERSAMEEERVHTTRQRNEMEHEMLAARRDRERSLQLVADREQELVLVRDREQKLLADRDVKKSGAAGTASAGTKLFGAAGGMAGALGGARFADGSDDAPPPPPPPGAVVADELTAIHGVGSELELFLHEHGLWSYRQVAGLTESEIDTLQAELPQFPNRIRNDDWVGQARHLHYERYGNLPED